MKKRLARIVVYFGLLCLGVLVLSHPYIWQSIFGPKIKGEPLWAWQQEFRARCDEGRGQIRPTHLWAKFLQALKIDSRPLPWIGSFDRSDPELLPVSLSLIDDADEKVRLSVVDTLLQIGPEERSIAALITMLDDPAFQVRQSALHVLGRFGPKGAAPLPKLRELLKDSEPRIAIHAALIMFSVGEPSPEARAIVYEGAKSTVSQERIVVYRHLPMEFKDDEVMFRILVQQLAKETDSIGQVYGIRTMGAFGKKSVPVLIPLLNDPKLRRTAALTLGNIGPDAAAAIPSLEQLVDSPDEALRWTVDYALKQIDPARAKKK